jgi:hypothetical protein
MLAAISTNLRRATLCFLCAVQVGEFLMVALGYALPAWQHLVLATACINAAALLLYPLVSESARWLLSEGRTEEATAILQDIAKRNGSTLPSQPMVASNSKKQLQQQQLQTIPEAAAEEGTICAHPDAAAGAEQQPDGPVGMVQLLRERRLAIRLVVLLVNWFSLMLNYYGISMGSGGIPGSM